MGILKVFGSWECYTLERINSLRSSWLNVLWGSRPWSEKVVSALKGHIIVLNSFLFSLSLSVSLPLPVCLCLTVFLSACLCFSFYLCLFVSVSLCLPICLSVRLSVSHLLSCGHELSSTMIIYYDISPLE